MNGRRADDVTIGEVYRRLVDMDERYEAKLNGIDSQVRLTNGRTTRLESEVSMLKSEVSTLRHLTPPALPSIPVTTQEGESLSIKISPKMWALIASAFMGMSMFGPVLKDWLTKWLGL